MKSSADVINIIGRLPVTGDPIFFRKDQLEVGKQLVYFGITDPNSIWEVTKITHAYFDPYSNRRYRKVNSPEALMDLVYLRRISNKPRVRKNGKRMSGRLELNFAYLSYSAIWRLA